MAPVKFMAPEVLEDILGGLLKNAIVLVVDDEEEVRDFCMEELEGFGFTDLTAGDGEEGVKVFREHGGEITCVILDLTMPKMDGVGAFGEISRIRPDVRVILSSGYDQQEATRRFAGQGLSGFIQKPYTLANLRDTLRLVVPPGRGRTDCEVAIGLRSEDYLISIGNLQSVLMKRSQDLSSANLPIGFLADQILISTFRGSQI